jgi:FKBP12-rapamycin complex-associated protein
MNPATIAVAAAALKAKGGPGATASTIDPAAGEELGELGVPTEKLNARALDIISRIQAKLTGWDFSPDEGDEIYLTVEEQVDRLIQEATSNENLCGLYSGWQPWW